MGGLSHQYRRELSLEDYTATAASLLAGQAFLASGLADGKKVGHKHKWNLSNSVSRIYHLYIIVWVSLGTEPLGNNFQRRDFFPHHPDSLERQTLLLIWPF